MPTKAGFAQTYRVHLEVPWLSWCVEVDEHFLKGKIEFAESNVSSVRIRAPVIGVQLDVGSVARTVGVAVCGHFGG